MDLNVIFPCFVLHINRHRSENYRTCHWTILYLIRIAGPLLGCLIYNFGVSVVCVWLVTL